MDDEQDMRPLMRSMALSATGEVLLLIGVLFILWGIASIISEYIGISGVGQFLVGGFLVIIAIILVMRSKAVMPKPMEKEEEETSDYR
ncbi:hypothetical protein KKB44_01945 [Candidatus Micrarchaeota archaeon]|nr:hypothetical protein [Candidatus Micrarchaeota archaeon]